MFKLNKKVEYALIALVEMSSLDKGEPVTAKMLVEKTDLPKALLGKILQSLNRSGIISSVQGVKGGYHLTRELKDLQLKEVIEAVEGPVAIADCFQSDNNCSDKPYCELKNPLRIIQNDINRYLMGINLGYIRDLYGKNRENVNIQVTN